MLATPCNALTSTYADSGTLSRDEQNALWMVSEVPRTTKKTGRNTHLAKVPIGMHFYREFVPQPDSGCFYAVWTVLSAS